ncbi:type II toxin-antitoxin system RelE/ParE family toxin [Candidatus Methylobacter oryzae]|nr:type II toxin-antitoxin system RelE/ParE family toxin [Candidatus Methylobacter oryzae]
MANYRLSKLADKDLGNIACYTIQRFGIRQASLYRDGLFKAFEMISDFPLIGSDQSQIKKDIRRHVHESHSIYYRVDVDEILILRILGPGEDPLQQLTL